MAAAELRARAEGVKEPMVRFELTRQTVLTDALDARRRTPAVASEQTGS